MSVSGDTVRLKATFYNFLGVLTDPTDLVLRIYDSDKNLLETPTLTASNHASTGVYQYDYTLPNQSKIYYEWSGTLEGSTALERGEVRIRWIE